ncbi:uncharacterized protein BXZ73DRAFT_57361, partial [Epithele typhae]|uniref:uncharacterized protein n=1 Tax=Epithele typhae TaxID=378194 RepID=UPI0020073EAE
MAARAKFNIVKTQIIPIGSEAFRERTLRKHNSEEGWNNYPRNVHMAEDGHATRVLGAWIGNKLREVDVWTPTLAKIECAAKKWAATHPTIEGKRHVIQMFFGGMTQYLTDVQRMPKSVKKRLTTMMRDFLWNERHIPPVAMQTMTLPFEQGGM